VKIIVIGSSTGGPQTLDMLLLGLPKELPVPVVLLQHLPGRFTASMATRMNVQHEQHVSEMVEGEILEAGHIYVAPGDCNFFLMGPEPRVRLIESEVLPTPSVDMGFTSVADFAGPEAIAVVLTGMGDDGTRGAQAIKQVGGHVIVQDEETSIIYGMPQEVKKAGFADEELPLGKIPSRLVALVT